MSVASDEKEQTAYLAQKTLAKVLTDFAETLGAIIAARIRADLNMTASPDGEEASLDMRQPVRVDGRTKAGKAAKKAAGDAAEKASEPVGANVTKDDVRRELKNVSKKSGLNGVRRILARFNVKKVAELSPDAYLDVVAACELALDEGGDDVAAACEGGGAEDEEGGEGASEGDDKPKLVTLDDVSQALMSVIEEHGEDGAAEVLETFDVKKASRLKKKDFVDVVAACADYLEENG